MKKLVYPYSIYFFVQLMITIKVPAQTIKTDKRVFTGNSYQLLIGDKIPLSLWEKIPKKKTTALVILDFWSTHCISCMQAFPRMESLQKQFDEKLQVVMINPWENEQQIKERMDNLNANRIKSEQKPFPVLKDLAAISGDTIYKTLFMITGVPQHVWADASGTILYITHGSNATYQKVQAVLNGEKLNLLEKNDKMLKEVREKGFLQPVISNEAPLYYSAFIPSKRYIFFSHSNIVDTVRGIWMKQDWGDVIRHFKNAFNGMNIQDRIVVEVKEKEKFEEPDDEDLLDDWYRNYCFTYEIRMPLKDKDNWKTKMQHDVNDFFGSQFGIEGVLEKRKFNTIVLVKTKDGLLKTAGGKRQDESQKDFINYRNVPYKTFVRHLLQLEDMKAGRPFLDESGVDPNLKIDMQLKGDLKDVENVRGQLKQYGLDIITGEREVEVLVIRDKKNNKQNP